MISAFTKGFTRFFAVDCKKTCCWNCHKMVEHKDCEFFCQNCHKLLPMNIDNYFTLFNLPKSYDIDSSKLLQTYKGYQRQVHPDKFYQASKNELSTADQVSCCVNDGYKTLSDPIKRGEYILQLYKQNTKADVPPAYLMDVLEIHEQVESASDSADLVKLLSDVQKRIHDEKETLSASLKINNNKITDPKAAAESLSKMRYLSRIRDTIREKLPIDLI